MSSMPMAAEYAKSGKAGCKGCKKNIAQGDLRVGFTGKANFGATAWYHYDCVWKETGSLSSLNAASKAEEVVDGVKGLDKTDQEKLQKDLTRYCKEAIAKGKVEKPEKEAAPSKPLAAEYAKSGKSTCKQCDKTIEKNSLRIGFTGKANFGATAWYHEECIWKLPGDAFTGITVTEPLSDTVEGFNDLRAEAQKTLKTKLPEVCGTKAAKRKSSSDTSQATKAKKEKKK